MADEMCFKCTLTSDPVQILEDLANIEAQIEFLGNFQQAPPQMVSMILMDMYCVLNNATRLMIKKSTNSSTRTISQLQYDEIIHRLERLEGD